MNTPMLTLGLPGLLHILGYLTGATLYAMLLAMAVRTPGRRDRLTLSTAGLGIEWNVGELTAHPFDLLDLPVVCMFNTTSAVPIVAEYPDARAGQLEARRAEADRERALDQTLADSFPASDPPQWTLGVARRYSEPHAIARVSRSVANTAGAAEVAPPRALVNDVLIVGGGSREPRTLIQRLATLAGAMGVALLVPVAVLVVGLPVVVFVRGIIEAITWLMTSVLR